MATALEIQIKLKIAAIKERERKEERERIIQLMVSKWGLSRDYYIRSLDL
jgi:hypothetical protein